MGNVFNYLQFAANTILGWKHEHFHYGFWKIQSTPLQGKSFLLGAFSAYFTKDSDRVGKPFDSSYGDLVDVICSAGLGIQTGPSAACTRAVISIRFQKKGTHCLFLEVQRGVLQSKLLPWLPTSISCFVLAWGPSVETLRFILSAASHRRVKSEFSPRLGSSEAIIFMFLML